MELVNMTLASVAIEHVSVEGDGGYKAARVTGKLTFDIDATGSITLSDHPLPIFGEDVETALGPLPRDTGGFEHEHVEVMINGAAYPPGGRSTADMQVTVEIDGRVLTADVIGDRVWIGEGEVARPSEPVPFTRMPMTYGQAYGGAAQAWIDDFTQVPIHHPANPLGLGFDARAMAEALCEQLDAPETFPRFTEPRRLPNVESPHERIAVWSDRPTPLSWSTRPVMIPGPVQIPFDAPPEPESSLDEEPPAWAAAVHDVMRARCHPDLLCETPPASIALRGMTPEGYLALQIPNMAFDVDYHIDGRTGTRPLHLRRVLVLPEERRFTCSYETRFKYRAAVGAERSLRVRLDV